MWEREDVGEILLRMPSCDEHGARKHGSRSTFDPLEGRRSTKDPSWVTPRSYVPDPSGSSGAVEGGSSQTPVVISDASEDEEDQRPLSSLWPCFIRRCRVEPKGSAPPVRELSSDQGGIPRYSRAILSPSLGCLLITADTRLLAGLRRDTCRSPQVCSLTLPRGSGTSRETARPSRGTPSTRSPFHGRGPGRAP